MGRKYRWMDSRVAIALLAVSALPSGCNNLRNPDAADGADPDVQLLVQWMSGSFDSRQQAEHDSEYVDLRLHVAPIWKNRRDGYWLYVEQTLGDRPDRPLSQRVYHLVHDGEETFRIDIHALPGDPLDFAGQWREPRPLASIAPGDLIPRDGCSIILRKRSDDMFNGGTGGKDCPSDAKGAAYAAIDVVITPAELVWWERGFNRHDRQVWGPVKGGYIFRRE